MEVLTPITGGGSDQVRMFASRVNLLGGDPSVLGPPGTVDALGPAGILPPPPRGILADIRDYAPARAVLMQDPIHRMLAEYARVYFNRYVELVETHVPKEHRDAFAFSRHKPCGVRIVASRTHGAAVIFDPDRPGRLRATTISDRIEFYFWPRTRESWSNPKTTFIGGENEFIIFMPGKGMYAGGALKLEIRGTLIYEGRMVLRGQLDPEEWSPAAASFDALHTFLRPAREIIVDQLALKDIEGQGTLDVRARVAALVRSARSDQQRIVNPLADYAEYFKVADSLGIHPFVAQRRLDDIIRAADKPGPRERFVEHWVRPVIQNVVAGLIIVGIGGGVALLLRNSWVGIVVVLALFVVWGVSRWLRK